jgi:predicted dehydrogenase
MVRSTPTYFRLHAFGRDGSAEALGRSELVVRRSEVEPQRLSFPPVDSVRANLEAFADAVAGIAAYPIPASDMLDTVAAFEAIAEATKSDSRVPKV